MQWIYILDGQQYDPVDEETLLSYLQSGQISPETQVWQEGMPEWVPAKIAFAMQLKTSAPIATVSAEQPVSTSKVRRWPNVIAVMVLLLAIGYTLSGLYSIFTGGDALQSQLSYLFRSGAISSGQMSEMLDGMKVKILATGIFACLTGVLGFFGSISLFRKHYSSGSLIVMFAYVLIAYLIVELLVSLSVGSELATAIKDSTGRSIDMTAKNGFRILLRLVYLAAPSFFILWFSRKGVRKYMKEHFHSPAVWQ